MSVTLVLAGGGPAALAWELGVLRGLADADAGLAQKVIDADTVIGTSAGSSDNRTDSCDSRYWGPISRSEIVGKVDLRIWPLNSLKFF